MSPGRRTRLGSGEEAGLSKADRVIPRIQSMTACGFHLGAWADDRKAAGTLGLLDNVGHNIHDHYGTVLL